MSPLRSPLSRSRLPIVSWRGAAPLLAGLLGLALAGCGSNPRTTYDPEAFGSTDTHTRLYEASEAQTCEAARRALLSQGYLVTAANSELVTGKKAFQPASEVHVELEFRVVCARDQAGGRRAAKGPPGRTLVFVSALQDRYSLKKVNNSASVGVGMIGSVSLPYSASDDSLVKVASQTVTDERFYERFFAIVARYLVVDAPEEVPPAVAAPVASPSLLVATPLPEAPAATAEAPALAPPLAPAPNLADASGGPRPLEPLGQPASMAGPAGAAPAVPPRAADAKVQ